MGWSNQMGKHREETEKINSDIFIVNEDIINLSGKKPKVIPDPSVIVKWFFKEDENNTVNAEIILQRYFNNEIRIITPELLLFELTNTIKNKLPGNKDSLREI